MKEKLKPCPFCGNDDCVVDTTGFSYYVTCLKCEAHGPLEGTKEEAMGAWNKRGESSQIPPGELINCIDCASLEEYENGYYRCKKRDVDGIDPYVKEPCSLYVRMGAN
jgi:Lar family restriction alleviation protein